MINPARVLLAATKSSREQLRVDLSEVEILEVATLAQANRVLVKDGIDFIVATIGFDGSQSIELLRLIRQATHHKDTPFILYFHSASSMQIETRRMFDTLLKHYNPAFLVDLNSTEVDKLSLKSAVARCLAINAPRESAP